MTRAIQIEPAPGIVVTPLPTKPRWPAEYTASVAVQAPPLPFPEMLRPTLPDQLSILILGGSGFISGALARAVRAGHHVTIVTRGRRPIPPGVHSLLADRDMPGQLEQAIQQEIRHCDQRHFDLVVDCIGYRRAHARQDLDLFARPGAHLVFLSSDLVYRPENRSFPQTETGAAYLEDSSAGAEKRRCELEFLNAAGGFRDWTVLRPTQVLGNGGALDFFPAHLGDPELLARLQRGEALRLAAGGHFLLQPLAVDDLVTMILDCPRAANAAGRILDCGGPVVLEVRQLFSLAARELGVHLKCEEVPIEPLLAEHPDWAPCLCHRFYPLPPLRLAGLPLPVIPPDAALHQQLGIRS